MYTCEEVSDHLATMEHIYKSCKIGDFVALPLRLCAVDITETYSGDPYTALEGHDMDGKKSGPIRMWGFADDGAMRCGDCVIIRGLAVALEKEWSGYSNLNYFGDINYCILLQYKSLFILSGSFLLLLLL